MKSRSLPISRVRVPGLLGWAGLGGALLLTVVPPLAVAQIAPYGWVQYDEHIPTPLNEVLLAHDPGLGVTVAVPSNNDTDETFLWTGTEWQATGQVRPEFPVGLVYADYLNAVLMLRFIHVDSLSRVSTWVNDQWVEYLDYGPPSRLRCGIAYDSDRHVTIVYGGKAGALGGPEQAVTWELRHQTAEWWPYDTTENGPDRRVGPAMVYDAAREVTVLFGGADDVGIDAIPYGDTWTWNGEVWQQVATTGPPPRSNHAMTYDPVRERVLLFGGDNQATQPNGQLGMNDLWEWDGTSWLYVESLAVAPHYRYWPGFAWDSTHGNGVISSGDAYVPPGVRINLKDTWLLYIGGSWVDFAYSGTETGAFTSPFNTLAEAQAVTPPRCYISIKPGTGIENVLLNMPLFLKAPAGGVVISGSNK